MIASQQTMDVVTNNLANVNTSGYKSDSVLFNEELERQMTLPNSKAVGMVATGPAIKQQFTNFNQGSLNQTNNKLDFAIEGNGMFAIQSDNGQISYTRNGAFTQSSTGDLITKDGSQVLDPSGNPIQFPAGPFNVTPNGTIQNPTTGQSYGQIGIYNGTFTKAASGLYASADATAQPTNSTATTLKQGALEGSNVNSISSMVQMIELGRNFDMAQKSMLAEDDMTQKLNTVLS
jgi:flagellar basal-body rod protein FlgB